MPSLTVWRHSPLSQPSNNMGPQIQIPRPARPPHVHVCMPMMPPRSSAGQGQLGRRTAGHAWQAAVPLPTQLSTGETDLKALSLSESTALPFLRCAFSCANLPLRTTARQQANERAAPPSRSSCVSPPAVKRGPPPPSHPLVPSKTLPSILLRLAAVTLRDPSWASLQRGPHLPSWPTAESLCPEGELEVGMAVFLGERNVRSFKIAHAVS